MSNPEPTNNQTLDPIPPELNSLISEEVLRARVQKIISAPKPPSRFDSIIRPLAPIVLTFVLTVVVGSWLTRRWEEQRLETSRKIDQTRSLITAFNDFLGTLSEQNARSLLVNHAITQGASVNELATLLRSEQEMFAKSRNKAVVLTFTIRELVPPEIYDEIKHATNDGLIDPLEEAMRMHDFSYYKTVNQPKSSEWRKPVDISNISTCGTALTDAIWYNTIAPPSNDENFLQKKSESLRLMDQACHK